LPTELVVHSLTLHTDGCAFESIPVRLNLSAATGQPNNNGGRPAANENEQSVAAISEVALLGVPKEPGMLTLTGYSCVVFDMENVCTIQQPLSVRVLPALPKLQLTTDLKRAPVVDEDADGGVAEATIFSGQT
jgi:hypothetical protein